MSDSKYPLTKALGVFAYFQPDHEEEGPGYYVVDAEELEKVLREAPVVHADPQRGADTAWTHYKMEHDTHTARLLCVQLIVRDTAESLLREYVKHWGTDVDINMYERARALLGDK